MMLYYSFLLIVIPSIVKYKYPITLQKKRKGGGCKLYSTVRISVDPHQYNNII